MAKADRKGSGNRPDVIIRKEEVVEGEAHGGAWKVAYADFVTAMMAFFLLMWLLNATTEDQRKGLADYFSPNSQLSHASSGTGDPFGGHTAFDQGALVSDRGAVQALVGTRPTTLDPSDDDAQPGPPPRGAADDDDQDQGGRPRAAPPDPTAPATAARASGSATPAGTATANAGAAAASTAAAAASAAAATISGAAAAAARAPTDAELRAAQERREKAEFNKAAQQIREAVQSDPALADLGHQLAVDMTPEGLRIQILDEDHRSMFPLGSDVPNDRAKLLLQKVTPVLEKLTQEISIAGYTDAAPFPGPDHTNWELSAERANATRRLLVEGGLPDSRIRSVTGNADRDPLLPMDPLAAENRRIAIVVLRTPRPVGGATAVANAAGNAAAGLAANAMVNATGQAGAGVPPAPGAMAAPVR